MSDDPARIAAAAAAVTEPIPLDEPEPVAADYVQVTEVEATPFDADDLLERRDAFGRVPVVVRIRRQAPIKVEWILLAIGLGASGVLLPLFFALQAVIIVAAIAALILAFVSRIFLRVPPGAVGLTIKSGRPGAVLDAGLHRVTPVVALTHLVSTREIAFDVPVSETRSKDGIAIGVDLMLTIQVSDPVRFAYQITTGDADALIHAAAQDAVRSTIRGIDSLAALDLGPAEADVMRGTIDAALARYGLSVKGVAFTRVTLPAAITSSLEARRLSAVRLAEASDAYALEHRRIEDQAALVAQEAEASRAAVEREAEAEAIRLAKLEERLTANPAAARYDLELGRLRVAERLAGNARAVVSMGGADLVGSVLAATEASGGPVPAAPPAASAGSAPREDPAGNGGRRRTTPSA